MKYYTVYKTTNKINGKYYVGKHETTNLNDRYLGSGTALGHAIKKYGRENFLREYLYIFDNREDMRSMEKQLVNERHAISYNIAIGGHGGSLKGRPTPWMIGKSSWNKGKKLPEHSEKMKIVMKGNKNGFQVGAVAWNKNIPMREETKLKQRIAHLGKIPPSNLLTGEARTDKQRAASQLHSERMVGRPNPNKGKTYGRYTN